MKRPIQSTTRALLIAGLVIGSWSALTHKLFAPPPGSGKGKATSVKITLLNLPGDCILSDGKGIYTDGVDRVTAVIHDSGQLDLNTTSTSTRRRIALNYSGLVLGSSCNRPGDPGVELPDLNCNGVADDPMATVGWVRLSTLDLNLLTMVDNETRQGGFGARFTDGCSASTHVPWTIRFRHSGQQDSVFSCGADCSAQVTVQAFDENPSKGVAGTGVDKWIIMAELSGPSSGAEACLWSGGTGDPVLREIVRMPFHMVVELK